MPSKPSSLTFYKIIALVLTGLAVIMLFLPWMTVSASILGSTFHRGGNIFDMVGVDDLWSVAMLFSTIIAIATIILAVIGIFKDRKLYVLPLAAMGIIMFLLVGFRLLQTKSSMDLDNNIFVGFVSINIGVGAWLFLAFSLGALGVLCFEDYKKGHKVFDFSNHQNVSFAEQNERNLGGWTCPVCGAECARNQLICIACGATKPEPIICPKCRARNTEDAVFCTNCGQKIE